MKRVILGVGVTLVGLLLMAGLVSAEIPHLINFQGRLTDTSGNPLNGNYNITFSIYSVSSGGTALWGETQSSVTVTNGIFNVLLGSVTEIPATVFEEKDRYLGIKVGTDPEMTPRQRITSVGYAFNADRVKGSNIFPSSGNVGIGTTGPPEKLQVVAAPSGGVATIRAHSNSGTNISYGALLATNSADRGVYLSVGDASVSSDYFSRPSRATLATSGGVPLDITTNQGNLGISVDTSGNVGIGTTSPVVKLDVRGPIRSDSLAGITDGAASFGYNTHWRGGWKNLDATQRGVFFRADGSTMVLYSATAEALPTITPKGGWYGDIFYNYGQVGIGSANPAGGYMLDVEGKIQAKGFDVGDITFRDQETQKILWRMFEDEEGLYLESLKTGKVYRFLLQEIENK